jgi:dTDP-4-amino-4,6-dideoxygalactose transaminase
MAARVTQALNFGFYGMRDSQLASTNGKMSEYHAAVGLAELDGWKKKQSALAGVIDCYQRLTRQAHLSERLIVSPDVSTSYVLFVCRSKDESASIQEELERSAVDFRLWYGTGLHKHTYFSDLPRDRLDVTEAIAPRLLGLPIAPDLSEASVDRVVKALTAASDREPAGARGR